MIDNNRQSASNNLLHFYNSLFLMLDVNLLWFNWVWYLKKKTSNREKKNSLKERLKIPVDIYNIYVQITICFWVNKPFFSFNHKK